MSTTNTFQFTVDGMSCQHCVKAVTQAIQAQDAGATVAIDLPSKQVTVITTLSREDAAVAITDEGYNVTA
ncbi:MAG: heavy-metal-associated domain-containing protein [Aquabacterium sp.]|uniref:heavy-metal-associated domain-containing protein n=1 Tax=Aquabacterium sp. TaxID=1872578 RepID=UPI003BDE91CA